MSPSSIAFIHRLLESDLQTTAKHFQPLIDQPNVRFSFSHKYSNAHAHAAVKPIYWSRKKLEPQLEELGVTSWLTIRNDDWFFLHWADPDFIRDYIRNFPEVGKHIDGIYIGSDGWVFSRVFTCKDPYYESRDTLDIQRTWLMQKLWGRIAYNPVVADDLFKAHLKQHYPEAPTDALFEAWAKASRAIRLFNEQVTGNWSLDFHWMPERWTDKDEGYRTLKDLAETEPMDGSSLVDIKKTAKCDIDDDERSALANADDIERLASEAGVILTKLHAGANKELAHNLDDIRAMVHLSLFGSFKLRAAIATEQSKAAEARHHMLTAYQHWIQYADIMDANYIGVDMQRNYHFKSWHQLDPEVLRDLTDLGGPVTLDIDKPYPWVRIVTPADLREIKAPADVSVSINAAAADQKPVKVELRDNGQLVHTSAETSFTHSPKSVTAGEHRLIARVIDSSGATQEHAVVFVAFDSSTKDTLPWKEEFNLGNGTTSDDGRTTWAATRSKGIFEIRDNALVINGKGNEGEFYTGDVDIAKGPVEISLDVTAQGGVDNGDYVRLYQCVDGGKEKLIGEIKGKQTAPITLKGTAAGQRLALVIRTSVSSDDESYRFDNIQIMLSTN
jgi:hypothetical protein